MKTSAFLMAMMVAGGPAAACADTHAFGFGAHLSDFKASSAQEGKTYVGGHFRARLTAGIGIEASLDYRVDKYVSDVQQVTIKSVPLLLSLTSDVLPHSPISPYLIAGGGWYFTKIHYVSDVMQIDDSETKFGYHVGAGIEVKPSPRFALHADYRYTSVSFTLLDFKFDAAGRMVTAGITVYF